MKQNTLQVSFSGGVVDPEVYYRYDYAKRNSALKQMHNFFPTIGGTAKNRAGTSYVEKGLNPLKNYRMIPFRFSDTQTYVLAFGDKTIQVLKDGGVVLHASGSKQGQAVVIETPYTDDVLFKIRYNQKRDILTLNAEGFDSYELKRFDHDNWALEEEVFQTSTQPPVTINGSWNGDAIESSTDYKYKITSVNADTLEESEAGAAVPVSGDAEGNWTANTEYIQLNITKVADVNKYNVYKEKNGLYGFIGSAEYVDGSIVSFKDTKIAPDLSDTPPVNRNPLLVTSDEPNNHPHGSTYYKQRKVFWRNTTMMTTQIGHFKSFNITTPTKDDDAITVELDNESGEMNLIKHIESWRGYLVIFTEGEEWFGRGSGGGAFTPKSMDFEHQTSWGSSDVPPLKTGDSLLFVQNKGSSIRDMSYAFESNGFSGQDLTVLVRYLFQGREIKDWAFAKEPYNIVWVIFDDGDLVGFTYLKEQDIWGWHTHSTKNGVFDSVCVVSEKGEDVPYFAIKRMINGNETTYFERLEKREIKTLKDSFFVDSGLRYSGAITQTVSNLEHLEGEEVSVFADGITQQPQTVTNGSIALEEPASNIIVGLGYESIMETLPIYLQNSQGRKMNIAGVNIKVVRSRPFTAGVDVDSLDTPVSDVEDLTTPEWRTGEVEYELSQDWEEEVSVYINMKNPEPLEISALIPKVALES